MWTPFNIILFVEMLFGFVTFIIAFNEWSTTNRWMSYTQWEWFSMVAMIVDVIGFVLIVIFASLKFPIQRTENPATHQYGPAVSMAVMGLIWGVLFFLYVLLYRSMGLPQNLFDQLNTISGDTSIICSNGGAGVCARWQISLGIFGLGGLGLALDWCKVLMSEIAPLKAAGSAGASAATNNP